MRGIGTHRRHPHLGLGRAAPVVLTAVVALCLGGCDSPDKAAPTKPKDTSRLKLSEAAAKNARLEVVPAGPAELERVFQQAGELVVAPNRQAQISAPLGGVVADLHVTLGQRVDKGQPLVTLESRELAELKLAYVAATQRLGPAAGVLSREEKLYERKLTTRDALLQKKADAQEAALSLQLARQKLLVLGLEAKRLAGLGRERAEGLKRLVLTAPLSGTVTGLNAIRGASVSASDKLGEIVDLTAISGELRLTAGRLEGVAPGLEVEVENAKTGLKGKARVDYVAPVADRATRSVLIRLAIPNADGQARPGCSFTASFRVRGARVPVAVPVGAVQEVEGRSVVFVRRSRAEFEVRPVVVGVSDGRLVEVKSGLTAGTEVVSGNSLTLKAELQKQTEQ